MEHTHFDVERDGFYGAYWPCPSGASCALIAMLGDDPEDHMARSAMKWLQRRGVNVLTMSPGKKDYSHHNYPLERIETAIAWLKAHGNERVGIAGASTTGTLALTAASMFPELTLTIAMTASDFVWQGFAQGKKDGCKEWPIPVERIRGKLLMIGAADDTLWDTAKYIRRMERRLAERPHSCAVEAAVYEHATHFVFPQSMLETMLPIGADLFVKRTFRAAKQYPKECRAAREDIERRMVAAIVAWRDAE